MTDPPPQGRGWHSRDYLPHFDRANIVQTLSYRLHDSVPAEVIEHWKRELNWREDIPADNEMVLLLRKRIAAYEDQGYGECWLRQEPVARLVQDAFQFFDGERYRLLAWCVMPNHVHVMIETKPGHSLGEVIKSWKTFTARQANIILNRTGQPFWFADYYDRFIRDEAHYAAALAYIHQNPVKARLCKSPQDWQWSSAASPGTASL
jgi:putative transposase